MATVLAPFGLRPVKKLGGEPWNHSFNLYKIPSNYTHAIGNGDPVRLLNTGAGRGQIVRFNETTTATTITSSGTFLGVLIGCQYTDPATGQFWTRQHYPGAIVASDIYAMVVDDPDVLFEAQADGQVAQTMMGCNFPLIQTAVTNATTGLSGVSVDASGFEETAALPVRVVDFGTRPGEAINDAFTNVLVRINNHFYRQTTGTDNT